LPSRIFLQSMQIDKSPCIWRISIPS
jgi:hypothetical protein